MKWILTMLVLLPALAFGNNVKAYYDAVNAAEFCILEGKFPCASENYRKAFRNLDQPFARHLFNAALVEARLGTYQLIASLFTQLMERGVPYSSLRWRPEFAGYFSSSYGIAFEVSAGNIQVKTDPEYQETLRQLHETDQQFRGAAKNSPAIDDSIRSNARVVINTLLALIRDKGFPTEQQVGVSPEFFQPRYFPLFFIHQASGHMQQFNLGGLLLENIDAGKLEATLGNDLINHMNGINTFGTGVMRILLVRVIDSTKSAAREENYVLLDSSDYGYFPLDARMTELANQDRPRRYLCDYETSLRKSLYELKHRDFILGNMFSGANLIYTIREGFIEDSAKLRH